MVRFTIDEIINAVKGKLLQQGNAPEIVGISTDNRKTIPGNLFIPIIGERLDGHQFIAGAVENGAAAVLTMREDLSVPPEVSVIHVADTTKAIQALGRANRLRYHIPIVAVTGSSGKTTTKDMIAATLSQGFSVMKTQGNLNNYLGVPQTLLSLNDTHQAAVIECGTGMPGEIAQNIGGVLPHFAVITNIGTAHLEFFHTRENILKGKMEILSTMGAGDVAILNGDDPYLNTIRNTPYQVIRIGIHSEEDLLDYKAKDIVSDEKGVRFTLNGESYHCRFPGEHMVRNCMVAIVIGKNLGLTQEAIQKGFDSFVPSGNRMKIQTVDGVTYIDDSYNANPDAMRAAMDALSDLARNGGKKIAVLADMLEMGEEAKTFHRQVGEYAGSKIDLLIAVGELAKEYMIGASVNLSEKALFHCPDAQAAASLLKSLAEKGDTVLIKGSNGMNLKQIMIQLTEKEMTDNEH